jgi:hypothetical protein
VQEEHQFLLCICKIKLNKVNRTWQHLSLSCSTT